MSFQGVFGRNGDGSSTMRPAAGVATTVPLAHHRHHPPRHDARYYATCYVAGGLSSVIRCAMSPLELIKTRLQQQQQQHNKLPLLTSSYSIKTFHPSPPPPNSTPKVWGAVSAATLEGGGLWRGLGPTAVAYWFQTSTKYTLYEMLKDHYIDNENEDDDDHNKNGWLWLSKKDLVYVLSAATAEAIADVLMCPWEMVKIQLQTATSSSSLNVKNQHQGSSSIKAMASSSFPSQFRPALVEMMRHRQLYRFPFGSLGPLWCRQVPGTIVNFVTFEHCTRFLYQWRRETLCKDDDVDLTTAQQLGISMASGAIAGMACAVASHPADSILSLRALPVHADASSYEIVQRVGMWRLATQGLAPRMVVTATVVSMQWLLYDSLKSLMGFGTSGGGSGK